MLPLLMKSVSWFLHDCCSLPLLLSLVNFLRPTTIIHSKEVHTISVVFFEFCLKLIVLPAFCPFLLDFNYILYNINKQVFKNRLNQYSFVIHLFRLLVTRFKARCFDRGMLRLFISGGRVFGQCMESVLT